jgi:peptide/nickel transport system permease protein
MILKLVLSRIATGLLTLLAVSFIIFVATEILPGDVAARALGRFATEEAKQIFRQQLHLDRPVPERYVIWLSGVVQGHLGKSIVNQIDVGDVVGPKLAHTLILATYALALYVPLSLALATCAAVFRDRPLDAAISLFTLVGLSVPEFALATILLIAFAVTFPIFPVLSVIATAKSVPDLIRTLTLPAVTLAIAMSVYAIRMLRDNLIEVLDSEYVRMATLKGVPRYRVVLWHALPNALGPALNVTALNLAYLIGGVVVVERVFSYDGIGSLLVESVFLRDAPLIEVTALVVSAVYILANLLADVMAIVLNPRLRTAR